MARKNEPAQEKYLGSFWRWRTVVLSIILVAIPLCFACSSERGQRSPTAARQAEQPRADCCLPMSRPESWWQQCVKRERDMAKGSHSELVFLGDSITAAMFYVRDLMQKHWPGYSPLELGIDGDLTGHVLWRIQNGELDGLKPKLIVLLIGTNNLGSYNDLETANGIEAVVKELRVRLPQTKLLVLGLLPRGSGVVNVAQKRVEGVNRLLADGFADGKNVFYLDIGSKLRQPDGSISEQVMPDYLHPSRAGYELLYAAIKPTVDRLLTD